MSSSSVTSHKQMQRQEENRQSSSTEPNNNNNNSRLADQANNKMPAKTLTRKRSSIQSNLSSMTNGSGHGSLHSSSSTATSGDDANDERPNYSNADYERIRNTTLLFFLDRLYLASHEGKEARTLHDLSCLFGTKEFTKDMRHIVGASRNGLKKFLQSYPSLFHIDGDKVYLTELDQGTTSTQRDYNKEAVEYFKMKLLQFGTSLVPIKNLFGHRSQANPEVRHVSGKNARDFKRFLKQNEDVFEILADEHVVLKSALAELESQGQTSLVLEQSLQPPEPSDAIVADPYLNKQLAHLIEDCIKTMRQQEIAANRLTEDKQDEFIVNLEILLERIQKHCQNELFLKMVKSQEDLKVFLRMHPKLFKRSKCDQGLDCVSLLSQQERLELEQAARAHQRAVLLQRQHSTLERSISSPSEQHKPLEAVKISSDQTQAPADKRKQEAPTKRSIGQESAREPQSLPPMHPQASSLSTKQLNNQNVITDKSPQQQHAQSKVSQSQASQQLRATAPPFVPSTPSRQNSSHTSASRQVSANQASFNTAPIQRSHSNLNARTGLDNSEPARRPLQISYSNAPAPVDQRPAIRNYLMKGNQASHHNMNWSQHSRQAELNTNAPLKALTNAESEMRARTVDIVREASNIITRIMTTTDAVAFDCKGYNLGFDGQITLIQFGFLPTKNLDPLRSFDRNHINQDQQQQQENQQEQKPKPEVCVFDLITNPELASCMKPLLESDKIVKIVHDVRNKSNALYVQFEIILNNVFDTQVANLVIQQQETGKPAYKSRYISMSKLCEIYGDEELMKYRNIIKHKTRHSTASAQASSSTSSSRNLKDVNYWRTRPLSKPMIFEATMDVYCLVGGIYQNLKARIKPEYEPLFDQLNREGVLARINPEEIRSAKKERKIDLEVIDLKRKLYGETTGPVVLSNREIRLLRHIDLTDEVRQKIQQCKKVAKKLERLDMKAAELQQELAGGGQPSSLTSNSQLSSMAHTVDDLQSMDCASLPSRQQQQQQPSEEDTFASKMDEFRATGMITNLMDSSMFDELKDKMIESSSLLESLEDDDDECVSGGHLSSGSHHSHNGSLNHDCCGCQCHKNSLDSGEPATKSSEKNSVASGDDAKPEVKTVTGATLEARMTPADQPAMPDHLGETQTKMETPTSCETNDQSEEVADKSVEQEADSDSKSSLACDMAVQCDLLS